MITSANDKVIPVAAVKVTDDALTVDLEDGRTISAPLEWYPRLVHGTARQRANVEIGPFGIHWPDLDEDVSVGGLLAGRASGEKPASLKKWLDSRGKKQKKVRK
jgi:hypothetical protein